MEEEQKKLDQATVEEQENEQRLLVESQTQGDKFYASNQSSNN
jgi:hypothetical protein